MTLPDQVLHPLFGSLTYDSPMVEVVSVRDLEAAEVSAAVDLHEQVLSEEFISQAGTAFLRAYYRAWLRAEGGLALAAVDPEGRLTGVLLGGLDPALHYRTMLRRDGWRLAGLMLVQAGRRPSFGRALVVTRGMRYSRGLGRMAWGRIRHRVPELGGGAADRPAIGATTGEVTHILVDPTRQGEGIGRSLVFAAVEAGRQSGLTRLSLVTTPELAASGFYERLGWVSRGDMSSRSGEQFRRYDFICS